MERIDEEAPLITSEDIITIKDTAGSRELMGLIFMAASAVIFSTMSVLVKYTGNYYSSFQIVFSRSLIQMILGLCCCIWLKINPLGPQGLNKYLLIARGAFGSIGLALYFFTLINMELGDGTTIFFTGPAITAIAAHFFLGEPLFTSDMISVGVCLLGVVLVARPGFLFGANALFSEYPYPTWIPALAAFGGAISSAGAYCVVRLVGGRVHFMVHVFYFGLVSTIGSGLVLIFTNQMLFHDLTFYKVGLLISVGLLAFIAQCFLNAGLQMANAGPASLMRTLDIFFAFIFGVVFFGEVPMTTSVIGASLIAASTASVALYKYYRNKST
jgi:drug/metabolite transporter (DMT)-like permease